MNPNWTPEELENKLIELRQQMDQHNEALVAALLNRLHLAEQINEVKKAMGKPIADRSREEITLLRVSKNASSREESRYIHNIFEEIFNSTKESMK